MEVYAFVCDCFGLCYKQAANCELLQCDVIYSIWMKVFYDFCTGLIDEEFVYLFKLFLLC